MPKKRIKRATILRPADIRHVLRVIDATSRWPARDALVFLMSVCTGMRCSEIARVTVADLLFPDGRLRKEVTLRAAITKGCHQRIAYFTNDRLIAAMERYLQDRLEKKIGLIGTVEYRGLHPDLPFVFSSRKGGFSMVRKTRTLEGGKIEHYEAADGLEALFRRLYDKSGLPDCSSHAGRRTFASRLLGKGTSSEDVPSVWYLRR